MLEAGRIALNGGIYCGDTRADVEAQHVAAIYTAMQAARPAPDLSNVEELVENLKYVRGMLESDADFASAKIVEQAIDTITVLLGRR
jgi:hypothetical protein